MTTNYIERPNTVKVFAKNAMDSRYLPVKFGMNQLAKDVGDIANDNFEFGVESLEGAIQHRDLNSVLKYLSSNLSYLFQQGVAEFSPYQDYPANALVQFDGALWISTKEIPASKHEPKKPDPCNPCGSCQVSECEVAEEPSKETGWCKLVTHCTYDNDLKDLQAKDEALEEAIGNLKGVTHFSILPNVKDGVLELSLGLSDGNTVTIPMTKFGHIEQTTDGKLKITNADGSKLELPKFVAEEDLNQQKGFYFNKQSGKWEVDLADLIENGSGLEVDRDGNIKVKPSDFLDGTSLSVDPATGKVQIKPDWYNEKVTKPIREAKQEAINETKDQLKNSGAKVYASSPITGDGQKTNPLGLSLGEGLQVINGKLTLKPEPPTKVTNITAQSFKFGLHTFNGLSDTTRNLPLDIHSAEDTQPRNPNNATQSYDYNGYYIASGNQLDIWMNGHENSAWYIMNDSGVDANGNVKDPDAWGQWQKLDNANNLSNQQIASIQNQLNGLGNQVTGLQQQLQQVQAKMQETCKVPVKNINSNYTIVDSDNVLVSTANTPITVTLNPDVIPMGRVFTVIQAGTGEITFANTSGSLHAPFKGGKKTAGQHAAVSVLFELNKNIRLMGQTKA